MAPLRGMLKFRWWVICIGHISPALADLDLRLLTVVLTSCWDMP